MSGPLTNQSTVSAAGFIGNGAGLTNLPQSSQSQITNYYVLTDQPGGTNIITPDMGSRLFFAPNSNVTYLGFSSGWASNDIGQVMLDIATDGKTVTIASTISNRTSIATTGVYTNIGYVSTWFFRKAARQTWWEIRQ